jgi:3',5'-cyclic AMP phosphodiesterase CpdA
MDRREFVCWSAALGFVASRAWGKSTKLSFRVGVVTDVQYADIDDAPPHLYRASPAKLRAAVAAFNRTGIDFAVHLGDFINGDWKSYDTVLPLADALKAPWHFVLGNHDFSVADDKKAQVPAKLGMPARYSSFEHKGWVFIALDGNDLSTYAWPEGSAEQARSKVAHDEKFPATKTWNGGIGSEQLRWLDETLSAADAAHRKVALLCHFPLLSQDDVVLWNAAEVLAHIERHPCVKLWLNGHDHDGSYAVRSGIHHLNFKGMLDAPEATYAVLSFYPDRVEVAGAGLEPSRTLMLRPS